METFEYNGKSLTLDQLTAELKSDGILVTQEEFRKLKYAPMGFPVRIFGTEIMKPWHDLFKHVDQLPEEVAGIVNAIPEYADYPDLDEVNQKLWELGFTFDYRLDAVPFGLTPVHEENGIKWYQEFYWKNEPVFTYFKKRGQGVTHDITTVL